MRFLKRFRLRALQAQQMKRYLSYAFGEIILVVIGILIALQINNWNADRQEQQRIHTYYQRIHEEISTVSLMIQGNAAITRDTMITALQRSLRIMDAGHTDSIDVFRRGLSYLTEGEALAFYFPVIDEFLAQGYLAQLEDSVLHHYFELLAYSRTQCQLSDDNARQYQLHLIKPYLQQHLNHADISVFNKYLVSGGPTTDYAQLLNDRQLWNLMQFQLEHLTLSVWNFEQLLQVLQLLDERLLEIYLS